MAELEHEHDEEHRRSDQEKRRTSTEQGLDLLADERTKEVLDKIGATIHDPNLRVVVIGKTGVGKTTLIEGLFEEYQDVTPRRRPTADIDSRTLNIKSPSGKPIAVVLTDTPGTESLVGVGKKQNRKEYLRLLSGIYKCADIVLYCLRMDDEVREDNVEAMSFLFKEFGVKMWAKLVFVFTFANRVTADVLEEDKLQVYQEQYDHMKKGLQKAMGEAGIKGELAKNASICVAGHPVRKDLPDCEDWTCPFLVNCLKSGITDNTRAALLLSTFKRWAYKKHSLAGTVAGAGVATGLGLVVTGTVMCTIPVTLPFGVPLAVIGGSIVIYSAAASGVQVEATKGEHKMEVMTATRFQNMQLGGQN